MTYSVYYSTFCISQEKFKFRLRVEDYNSSRSNLSDWLSPHNTFPFSAKGKSNMDGGKRAHYYCTSIVDGGSGGWWYFNKPPHI